MESWIIQTFKPNETNLFGMFMSGCGPRSEGVALVTSRPSSASNDPTRPIQPTTQLDPYFARNQPRPLTYLPAWPITYPDTWLTLTLSTCFLHKTPKALLTLTFYNEFCLQLKWKLARVFAQGLLSLYNVQNSKRAFCQKSICSGSLKGFRSLSKPHWIWKISSFSKPNWIWKRGENSNRSFPCHCQVASQRWSFSNEAKNKTKILKSIFPPPGL